MKKSNKREGLDEVALEAARLKIEDTLIELRDARIGMLLRGNGFVVKEKDGSPSSIIRLSTPDGLRIGIETYLKAIKNKREGV